MPDRIQPGYISENVQVRSTRDIVLHASGAETASGNSAEITVGDYTEGLLDIDVSAVTGTSPTADFSLETYVNGQWRAIPGLTLAQQTATGSLTSKVTNFGEKLRLSWTLGGTTPSFTFSACFLAKS